MCLQAAEVEAEAEVVVEVVVVGEDSKTQCRRPVLTE
jgi:hypothetical protein